MSFLEEENAKSSSFWDWVIGIGLVVLITGFTVFYQFQKHSSSRRFREADALFQAGKYRDASVLYEELKSAQYLTPKNDSVIYQRLDSIQNLQEQQKAALARIRALAAAKDTAGARKAWESLPAKGLLAPDDSAWGAKLSAGK